MTKLHYNVRPRYTAGSPAAVECEIAEKVAQEELAEHERCLSGVYGEDQKLKAMRLGLEGIAEKVLYEKRKDRVAGLVVYDLCTHREYWRPLRSGSGIQEVPSPEATGDHDLDEDSLDLFLCDDGQHAQIVGTCKLCGKEGRSAPIPIFFADDNCKVGK